MNPQSRYLDIETTGLRYNFLRQARDVGLVQLNISSKAGSIHDLWTDISTSAIQDVLQGKSTATDLLNTVSNQKQPWQSGIHTLGATNENIIGGIFRRYLGVAKQAYAEHGSLMGPKDVSIGGSKSLVGVSTAQALDTVADTLESGAELKGWNFGYDIGELYQTAKQTGHTRAQASIAKAISENRIVDVATGFHDILFREAQAGNISLFHASGTARNLPKDVLLAERQKALSGLAAGEAFTASGQAIEEHGGFKSVFADLKAQGRTLSYPEFQRELFESGGSAAKYTSITNQSFAAGKRSPSMKYVGMWSLDAISKSLGIQDKLHGELFDAHNAKFDNWLVSNHVEPLIELMNQKDLVEIDNQLNKKYNITRKEFFRRLQYHSQIASIDKSLEQHLATDYNSGRSASIIQEILGETKVSANANAQIKAMNVPSPTITHAAAEAASPFISRAKDFFKTTTGKAAGFVLGLATLYGMFGPTKRAEAETEQPYLTTNQIQALPDTVRGTYLHGLLQSEYLRSGYAAGVEIPTITPDGPGIIDAVSAAGVPIEIKTSIHGFMPNSDHIKQLRGYMEATEQPYGRLQYIDFLQGPGMIREYNIGLEGIRHSKQSWVNEYGINPSALQNVSDFRSGRSWPAQLGNALYQFMDRPSPFRNLAELSTLRAIPPNENKLLSQVAATQLSGMASQSGMAKMALPSAAKTEAQLIQEYKRIPAILHPAASKEGIKTETLNRAAQLSHVPGGLQPLDKQHNIQFVSAGMNRVPPFPFQSRSYQPNYLHPVAQGISTTYTHTKLSVGPNSMLTGVWARNSMFEPNPGVAFHRHGMPHVFTPDVTAPRIKNLPVMDVSMPGPGIQGPWNTQIHGIHSSQTQSKFPFSSQANEQENVNQTSEWISKFMWGGLLAGAAGSAFHDPKSFMANIGSELLGSSTNFGSGPLAQHAQDVFEHLQLRYRMHPEHARELLAGVGINSATLSAPGNMPSAFNQLPKPFSDAWKNKKTIAGRIGEWWKLRGDRKKQVADFYKWMDANPTVTLATGRTGQYVRSGYQVMVQKMKDRLFWASGGPGEYGIARRYANLFMSNFLDMEHEDLSSIRSITKDLHDHAVSTRVNPNHAFTKGPHLEDYGGTTKTFFGSEAAARWRDKNIVGFLQKRAEAAEKAASQIQSKLGPLSKNDPRWVKATRSANMYRQTARQVGGLNFFKSANAVMMAGTYITEFEERYKSMGGGIRAVGPAAFASTFSAVGAAVGAKVGSAIPYVPVLGAIVGSVVGMEIGRFLGDVTQSLLSGILNLKPVIDPSTSMVQAQLSDPYRDYYRSNMIPGVGHYVDEYYGTPAINGSGVNLSDFRSPWTPSVLLEEPSTVNPMPYKHIHMGGHVALNQTLQRTHKRSSMRSQRARLGMNSGSTFRVHPNTSRMSTMS